MHLITLAEEVYRDKVYACWMGKNIGGTLGGPWEGRKEVLHLSFYDPLPTEPQPNDDLDFQLVWLKMLQDRGVNPALADFADYWVKHLSAYPWNEYGICRHNLDRGLRPPISGCFENYFIDEMGAPIRSEIWACVAPADPGLAAALAWQDAVLDHAGGEGVYGEMFWAALESTAFVVSDPLTLIRIGLAMIPVHSAIARSVREAVWCWQNEVDWLEARGRILAAFGHQQPCNAAQNHGFTILGWLYGEDFGAALCQAVNCGYDTDCTGATLGAVLGLVGGTQAIPHQWAEPVGDAIVLHKFTQDLQAPQTVSQLTDQTVAVGTRLLAERSEVSRIGPEPSVPEDLLTVMFDNTMALKALAQDPQSVIERVNGCDIALHYGGEPVIRPGPGKIVGVSVLQNLEPVKFAASIDVPTGWTARRVADRSGQQRFLLQADEVADNNYVTVTVSLPDGEPSIRYILLGPKAARGLPAVDNVEKCPQCGARLQACICAE